MTEFTYVDTFGVRANVADDIQPTNLFVLVATVTAIRAGVIKLGFEGCVMAKVNLKKKKTTNLRFSLLFFFTRVFSGCLNHPSFFYVASKNNNDNNNNKTLFFVFACVYILKRNAQHMWLNAGYVLYHSSWYSG